MPRKSEKPKEQAIPPIIKTIPDSFENVLQAVLKPVKVHPPKI